MMKVRLRRRRPEAPRLGGQLRDYDHVVLTIRVHEEPPYFVGEAVELGISSFGETLDEALSMTLDAVCTHLNVLETQGLARRFLEDAGMKVHSARPAHEDVASVNLQARPGEVVAPRIVPVTGRIPVAVG